MNNPKKDNLDIEIDIEECVPTVRINPGAYRAKLEEQAYAEFWYNSCLEEQPITQRAKRF